MNQQDRELLQQALDVLEQWEPGRDTTDLLKRLDIAIAALRERLAQPEQEPVAWMKPHPKCDSACLFQCTKGFTQFPECAAPPESKPWVGLTEEDLSVCDEDGVLLARYWEDKLREKNA